MITILNYGLGNIQAFANVYKRLHVDVVVASDAAALESATAIILPGVGSFDHAMELLNSSGMRQLLDEMVIERSVPVLGVCVGMQIMARESDEGKLSGLGWIEGRVCRLQGEGANNLMLPHMGWNNVRPRASSLLFDGLEADARFYFLHSYGFCCNDDSNTLATTDYGAEFTCAVHRANIFGVQFHPEKSHHFGSRLLLNFARVV